MLRSVYDGHKRKMVPHDGQLRSRVDRLVYDNGWLRRRRAAKVRTMHPHCCLHCRRIILNSRAIFKKSFQRPRVVLFQHGPFFIVRYLSFCPSLAIFFPIVLNLSCPSTFETSRAGAWCRVRLTASTATTTKSNRCLSKEKSCQLLLSFPENLLVAVKLFPQLVTLPIRFVVLIN